MDLLTRLRKKYDDKTLVEVETDIFHLKKTMISAQKGMVEGIYYLQSTERFKEDKTYANSSFELYIKDKFSMLPKTYNDLRIAFHNFREVALEYGPGIVTSIRRTCGAEKMGEVLREIKATDDKAKKPITREKMQKIIEKHKKARLIPAGPTPKKDFQDWRAKYEAGQKRILLLESELEEAHKQVDRLKATVLRLNSYQSAIQDAAMKFQDESAPAMAS